MIRKILGRLVCPLATLALALPASAGERQGGALPFEELAREWLEIHVAATAPADPRRVNLDAILAKNLAHVRLGAFEILVPPASLVDPKMQDEIAAALQALFCVQAQWLEWTSGGEPLSADVRGTLKTVESWLESWKRELPSDARALAGAELFTLLEPEDDVRAALQDFSGLLSRGGGLELSEARTARLILMPSRRDFVGFVSLLGWKLEKWRSSYWCDGLRTWTEFDYAGTLILALEFAAPGGDPFRGSAMTAKNPRGLEQHVAQLATISLLDAYFGERMEPALVAGLANSIVIGGWGEVDTRTDGDLRARQKLGRSVFVPGGNSEGGTLAPQNANSRWRDGQGEDHFVKALRAAQQSGAKESKTRKGPAGFLLLSDDESERTVVHGPFLLGEAAETAPPAAFGGDHAEFQRAYCTGFVYWLRERAEGSSQKSRARFTLFLRLLAAAPASEAFASAYEAPLSTAEMDDSSLEGRFVLWLRKR